MSDQIILDQQTFKALAAGTRVQLLKLLHDRKYMQTELASELGMAVPTIKEHLDALAAAGLVLMVDEGRKWKYYELTPKGRALLEPQEDMHRVLVMLSVFLFAFLGGVVAMLLGASPFVQTDSFLAATDTSPVASQVSTAMNSEHGASARTPNEAGDKESNAESLTEPPSSFPVLSSDTALQSVRRESYGWSSWFLAYAALLLCLLAGAGFAFVKYQRSKRQRKKLLE